MIEAKQNKAYLNFISWYSRIRMRWHFKSIQIIGEFGKTDAPLLVISNHFSWWDGFFVQYLNQNIFKRNFYFMMLEEQLKKRMFLNKCGGFSVNKNPKDLINSVNHAASLLEDKNNLVLIFPQGRIETKYRFPFEFERGIEEIVKRTSIPVQIIFIANIIDYFSDPSPSLYIYYDQPDFGAQPGKEMIENAYNTFFSDCVSKQKES
jgi:1-acyl-sn-glycerol-3-phosphate acyltransferase